MLALPFVARSRINKLRRAGVPVFRAHETLGHATGTRPLGPLVWIHAASVGESRSALPLLQAMQARQPDLCAVLTSVTPSSAEVLEKRLPPKAVHQFAPLDGAGPVGRFLKHWRPDLGIFVESEIWPNMILRAHKAEVPLALVNARLSDRSLARWHKVDATARSIFQRFGIIHCQDARTAKGLSALGLPQVRAGINLKSVVSTPKVDLRALNSLKTLTEGRPVWSAVSTHPGEDEIMIAAHTALRAQHPEALLILVPRHPERTAAIRALCTGHAVAQRSLGEDLTRQTSIYLADTMGETDLWFALAPICCLCGSFGDAGGHTPYEPAAAGAALLHGPHFANHVEAFAKFQKAEASLEVVDAQALHAALDHLVRSPQMAQRMADAAKPLAASGLEAVDHLARECLALGRIER